MSRAHTHKRATAPHDNLNQNTTHHITLHARTDAQCHDGLHGKLVLAAVTHVSHIIAAVSPGPQDTRVSYCDSEAHAKTLDPLSLVCDGASRHRPHDPETPQCQAHETRRVG